MSTEETMEISTEVSTEIAVEGEALVDASNNTQILENIATDVRLIAVLALLTFITSCFRGWRKNTIKGAR